MLTATPINNRLSDFRHMVELFTRREETLLRPHARRQQPARALQQHGEGAAQSRRARPRPTLQEHLAEAQEILATDDDLPGARRPAQPRLRAREPDPGDRQGRRRSRSASRRRSPTTRSGRPTASCSTCSRRRSRARSRSSRCRCTTRSPTTRAGQRASTRSRRTARSRSSA